MLSAAELGDVGLACADGSNAPDSFRVGFREHGHRFDWGILSWCQMLPAPPSRPFDEHASTSLHELLRTMPLPR